MFGRTAYTPLVQFLNPKIRYMGNFQSLLALDVFRDINPLAIHNIKLSRERQENQFPAYPEHECHAGDKVLVINHFRDMWDPKYDVTYCVIYVIKLTDTSGKIC